MTQDEIIRIATEAGFQESSWNGFLKRFAALIAAHEREACAKLCEQLGALNTATPHNIAAAIRGRIVK